MNTIEANRQNVSQYYNEFKSYQTKVKANLRHYFIFNECIKAGLKKDDSLLEIGCGIGTLTGLFSKYLKSGSIVSTDISNESIEIAKKNVGESSTRQFIVTDMKNFKLDKKFDFVILADVLEHIPLDQHREMFMSISSMMNDNALIFINIPHPLAIEYVEKKHPEKLQIIDQALHADVLFNNLYFSNFILDSYISFPLYRFPDDYCLLIVKKNIPYKTMSMFSKPSISFRKTVLRFKYWLATI